MLGVVNNKLVWVPVIAWLYPDTFKLCVDANGGVGTVTIYGTNNDTPLTNRIFVNNPLKSYERDAVY